MPIVTQRLQLAKNNMLPKSIKINVNELFYSWLMIRKNNVKQSTYASYRFLYQNYISEQIGNMRADKVTSFMINCYVSELLNSGRNNGKGLFPTSVKSILVILKSVFNYGEIEYGLENPAKNISLPKSEH